MQKVRAERDEYVEVSVSTGPCRRGAQGEHHRWHPLSEAK